MIQKSLVEYFDSSCSRAGRPGFPFFNVDKRDGFYRIRFFNYRNNTGIFVIYLPRPDGVVFYSKKTKEVTIRYKDKKTVIKVHGRRVPDFEKNLPPNEINGFEVGKGLVNVLKYQHHNGMCNVEVDELGLDFSKVAFDKYFIYVGA